MEQFSLRPAASMGPRCYVLLKLCGDRLLGFLAAFGALGLWAQGLGFRFFGALRGAACRYSYKVFQDWCWRLPGFLESEKNFTTDYIMSFVSVCLVSRVCGFSG